MDRNQKKALTDQKIRTAFIMLLNEKGFANLNVSDITITAEISRGTFYLHYLDKFDLLEQIEQEILDDVQTLLQNNLDDIADPKITMPEAHDHLYNLFFKLITYGYQHRPLFISLMRPDVDVTFSDRLYQLVVTIFRGKNVLQTQASYSTEVPEDYAEVIVILGAFNIFKHWLLKENPETPTEVAEIILTSRFLSPYNLIHIN
ncbi:TetR/AcrR family transcriptional regulator [Latilactobacillus fuchuensis]|uniref:Transcriptional regulator n=1 Tax=Latilactobacillus fuchuensis TaxID=164393 RepID=A0A2N9DYD2_9LACO|nr:TetR/AcrR family transcriptional regulator [Latilactobacillus fuchuensis]SPC40131.1 Transcriptional regulator [Latilactobacillus fuchuensis]